MPEDTFAWSDGSYVHRVTREPIEDGPDATMSSAATFDGTVVCNAPGEIRRREGGWRSLVTVGDRTFEEIGDAEGNADVVNEDGVSVNGDDDAGSHEFSPDGSSVVYGDYGTGPEPAHRHGSSGCATP